MSFEDMIALWVECVRTRMGGCVNPKCLLRCPVFDNEGWESDACDLLYMIESHFPLAEVR